MTEIYLQVLTTTSSITCLLVMGTLVPCSKLSSANSCEHFWTNLFMDVWFHFSEAQFVGWLFGCMFSFIRDNQTFFWKDYDSLCTSRNIWGFYFASNFRYIDMIQSWKKNFMNIIFPLITPTHAQVPLYHSLTTGNLCCLFFNAF